MPILETNALTRRFGALTAVDRLTIAVDFGVLAAAIAVLVVLGAWLYPRVAT